MGLKKIFLSACVFVFVLSCSGKGKQGVQEQPPVEADAVVEEVPAAAAKDAAETAPPPEPPPMTECLDWKPKKFLEEAGDILKEMKGKSIADLKSVKCFTKASGKKKKIFQDCEDHECLAWLDYWSKVGTNAYKQLDMDGAMMNFLLAAKLAKECGIGGQTAAGIYIQLAVVLINGYGEIMKGSLAFRWAILYDWEVELPPVPVPNVKKTFEVVKQSMGTEPFSCIE